MYRSLLTVGWLVLAVAGVGCRRSEEPPASERLFDLAAMQKSQPAAEPAWPVVTKIRSFAFPQDHAAHPDYRIEWWYYTGNLDDGAGRQFGFQLTFFRSGIRQQPASQSVWALRDLYTAHFAISDLSQRRHDVFQRNNRKGIGWADAMTERCEVWNGDWRLNLEGESHHLVAAEGSCALDLMLTPTKPAALHGDRGLSRKGPSAGNASYYYSLSRMLASGTLRAGGKDYRVNGNAWMDHEFSSSFLEPGQTGWDWFAIQLDNGCDLMLYRVRRADGALEPCSSGSLIGADGRVTHLSSSEFKLSSSSLWKSPDTNANYPLRWRIDIPKTGCQLEVTAAFPEQEMATVATTGLNYWEGSIDIRGSVDAQSVRGRGYMELTGYGPSAGKDARLPFQSASHEEVWSLESGVWSPEESKLRSDYRLLTTGYRLPATDYRLLTTDYPPHSGVPALAAMRSHNASTTFASLTHPTASGIRHPASGIVFFIPRGEAPSCQLRGSVSGGKKGHGWKCIRSRTFRLAPILDDNRCDRYR